MPLVLTQEANHGSASSGSRRRQGQHWRNVVVVTQQMSPGHHGGRIAELIPGVVVGSPTSTVVVAEATAFEELPAAATRSEPTFGLSGSFVEPQILFGLTEALHNLPALLYTKRRCVTKNWRHTSRQYVVTLHCTRKRTPDANNFADFKSNRT